MGVGGFDRMGTLKKSEEIGGEGDFDDWMAAAFGETGDEIEERVGEEAGFFGIGVGDAELIQAATPVCTLHKSFLIIDESDLYDYLTSLDAK